MTISPLKPDRIWPVFKGELEMPEISIQKQCATLTDLVDAESFGEPIGDLPKQTDSGFFAEGNLVTGTWECEPGNSSSTWRSQNFAIC